MFDAIVLDAMVFNLAGFPTVALFTIAFTIGCLDDSELYLVNFLRHEEEV